MRILDIDIDGFGRLVDFHTKADPGFNLVFGLNESGKSTLQAFVKAVFFSMSGYEAHRFKPWASPRYSGSIRYSLDDGRVYMISRDFGTGAATVSDENGKKVSDDRGFFMIQTGTDPAIYSASAYMEQTQLKFSDEVRQYLDKYLVSKYCPGCGEFNLEETLELLSRYSGSDESIRLENEIVAVKDKIRELRDALSADDIKLLEKKYEIITRNHEEMKRLNAKKEPVPSGKADTGEISRLADLKNEMISIKGKKDRLLMPFFIFCFGAIGLGIYSFIKERTELYPVSLGILLLSFLILLTDGVILYLRNRRIKTIGDEAAELADKHSLPCNISLSDLIGIRNRMAESDDEDPGEVSAMKFAAIKLNADREIGSEEDIPVYLDELRQRIERQKYRESDPDSSGEGDTVRQLQEKLARLEERHREAARTGRMFETAMDAVRNAGRDPGIDHRKVFAGSFAEIMKVLTAGRYDDIETDGGSTADRDLRAKNLSSGTLEQLYLAIRLTSAFMIAGKGEKMPLFMDEIFAYSDEKRIVEALKYFKIKAGEFQIFYLTCRRTEASIAKTLMGESVNIIRLKV